MPGQPVDAALAAQLTRDLTATSGESVEVLAPFTGAPFHSLPHSSTDDVATAAAAARAAQPAWAASGPAVRRAVLLRAHDLLMARREEILDAVQTETGKSRGQAFEEFFNAAAALRHSALAAGRVLRPERRHGGIPLVLTSRVIHKPKGLVGVITPWNYPVSLTAMDVVPALAAGNGVLQKADDQGAVSILAFRRVLVDAGVPPELWGVVAGPGTEIGSAVVDAADIVAFTGSTATGTTVARRAAEALTPVSLELGGKNAVVVLDDVDIDRAALSVAHACFSSAGQLCVSGERLLVHRGVADRFLPAFARAVAGLRLGAAFDHSTDLGSLTTAAQLDRVRAHVDDAVAKGATVLAGGRHRPELGPLFFEPTVLADVSDDMACAREETFGPVVAVTVVDDDEAAIAAANDSAYGLNASVFGRSVRRMRAVAERLEVGTVNLNEGYRASFGAMDAPSGGVKRSGIGRRNGAEGILRYADAVQIARATGLVPLPRTGEEYGRLVGTMVATLWGLRLIRRR